MKSICKSAMGREAVQALDRRALAQWPVPRTLHLTWLEDAGHILGGQSARVLDFLGHNRVAAA